MFRTRLVLGAALVVSFAANLNDISANDRVRDDDSERSLRELAHDLAMLSTGGPASDADLLRLAARGYSPAAFSDFIGELVRRPEFAEVVSEVLRLKGSSYRQIGPMMQLETFELDGRSVFFTRERCSLGQVEAVHPWWDLGTTVLVCRDSYRPDVFQIDESHYCSGLWASDLDEAPCGCGPNLMRCFRNREDTDGIAQGLSDEMSSTVRHVVAEGMPVQRLFDSQESFRGPWSQLVYLKFKVENGDVRSLVEVPDWRDWPTDGQWAARPESESGQHAGVFTNPYFLDAVDSQRLKASLLFETLWCTEGLLSSGVETETVLNASAQRATSRGWESLAALPGCTECHARIEHAVQFAQGIPYWVASTHYVARRTPEAREQLYGRNIDDLRGEGLRTPRGLIDLTLAQPEFPACMAKRFRHHVFGSNSPENSRLDATLQQIVRGEGSFRDLMAATLDQYARSRRRPHPTTPPLVLAENGQSPFAILRSECGPCHVQDESPVAELLELGATGCDERSEECATPAAAVLSSVLHGRMPPGREMDRAGKRLLLEGLAPRAWPDVAHRRNALRYADLESNAHHVHRTEAIISRMASNNRDDEVTMPPHPALLLDDGFSVTLGAVLGLSAVDICRSAQEIDACLERAITPQLVGH